MKQISEKTFRIFAIIFYFALAFYSLRSFIFEGRFWAEEGTFFYLALLERGISGVFSYTFQGHLELFTNLVVYISTLVDLRYAPLVTTLLSFVLQSLPFLILILKREELNLSRVATFLFIILVLGSPGAAEVAANSINLHFHFTLLAIIILFLPVTRLNNFLLLLAGLSGIPANVVSPFYLYAAYYGRKRLLQFFILLFTSCLQLLLLLNNQEEIRDRAFTFSPIQSAKIFVNQELILPFVPFQFAEPFLKILRSASVDYLFGWFFFITLVFIFICFIVKAFRGSTKEKILILLNIFLALFFIITSHKESLELIHSIAGCRYFYPVYATSVLILLYWLDRNRPLFLKVIFMFLIAAALCRISFYPFKGPQWNKAYENGKTDQSYAIWPEGWNLKSK